MEKTDYYSRYKQFSFILNPAGNRGVEQVFLNLSDRKEIHDHIVRLNGSENKEGMYYSAKSHSWVPAVIPAYRADIVELKETFEEYQNIRIDEGHGKEKEMPTQMADQLAQIEAHLAVAEEELNFLKIAHKKAPIPVEERQDVLPPKRWGTGKLLNGDLVTLGGFTVSKNEDGIPCINDDRSKHSGMEAWRFKKEIVKPMVLEEMYRDKIEREAVKNTHNREYKKPAYPEAGIWHKESNVIEYPNYSAKTLDQIKALI